MKKKFIVLISCIIIMILFNLFAHLYNNILMPFKGENKDILYSPTNYNLKLENRFEKFYYEFIQYENYERKYDTKFYYCFGRKSLVPQYTLTFNKYGMESYSYVINCEEDYDLIKEKILNDYQFVKIPVLLSYEFDEIYYESFIEINRTIYQELHYNYFIEDWEYEDPERFRTVSYWFGYNEERKEIIFSLLYRNPSDRISIDSLKVLMEKNLYS